MRTKISKTLATLTFTSLFALLTFAAAGVWLGDLARSFVEGSAVDLVHDLRAIKTGQPTTFSLTSEVRAADTMGSTR